MSKTLSLNSKVFKSGKYLVVKSTLKLLNAFGQSEDTPLDGSDFISINEYALDGCKSHEFVNLFSGGKFTTYENSFYGLSGLWNSLLSMALRYSEHSMELLSLTLMRMLIPLFSQKAKSNSIS